MTPHRIVSISVAALAVLAVSGCDPDEIVKINDPADLAGVRLSEHAGDMFEEVNIDVAGVLVCDMDFGDGNVSGSCDGTDLAGRDLEVTLTGTASLDDGTCDATVTVVRDDEVEADESGFDCLEGIDTSDD